MAILRKKVTFTVTKVFVLKLLLKQIYFMCVYVLVLCYNLCVKHTFCLSDHQKRLCYNMENLGNKV